MGMTLRQIIFDTGGGIPDGKTFKAVQTGGPSGGLPAGGQARRPVDFDTLVAEGSMMGSGGMIVMDEDTCMVDVAKYFLRFLASESCGNCTSCREGSTSCTTCSATSPGSRHAETIALVEELADTVEATSLCALGTSAVNPVLSTLRYFRDEYLAHVDDQRCPAGVCKTLITSRIDGSAATGACCAPPLPAGRVAGEKKQPHTIDQELCIKCGICRDVCKRDAVLVQ